MPMPPGPPSTRCAWWRSCSSTRSTYSTSRSRAPPPPAPAPEGRRSARERAPLPTIADGSCLGAADIPKLAGVVDGINIKLAKCGGIREALKMIATARAHGMLVMAGCMIETSLGISAAAHFAPLLDYADLDGAALLADDPFRGASMRNGQLALSTGAGLGVTRR